MTERSVAELCPWLFLAGDRVVVNKDSSLLASFSFTGMDEEGQASSSLNDLVRRTGSALRGWDDRPVQLWWTLRRRRILDYPAGDFPDPVSRRVNENRRHAFLTGDQFRNTHYLSACLMPERGSARLADRVHESVQEGAGFWSALTGALRTTFDPAAAFAFGAAEIDTQVDRFEALLGDFVEPLRDLALTRLSGESLMAFLHGQASPLHDRQQAVACPVGDESPSWFLDAGLPDAAIDVYEDHLRLEGDRCQHVAAITVSRWREGAEKPEVHPGFLDALARLPVELTVSHIFRLMPRKEALDHIERVRWWNGMAKTLRIGTVLGAAANGGSTAKAPINKAREQDEAQADEALTALNSGSRQFGWHNTTVLVFGDTPVALEEGVGLVTAALRYQGVVLVRERLHCLSAFAGTWPGQHELVQRWRVLSSQAQACVAPLFSIRQGDPVSRHLTEQTGRACSALAVLPTGAGMPFYFDPFVGDVAHTLILGPTGAGKTVIVSFFMAMWRKYHPCRIVIFDKDLSCRIQTLLMGGRHVVPSSGGGDGVRVNPLAWLADRTEWGWIARWVEMLIVSRGYTVSAEDERLIHEAVEATAALPREDWRLLSLASGLPSRLREQLSPWIGDGPQAAFFDNVEDGLAFDDITCIEMGEVFLYPHVARAFLDYAFHRLVRTIMEPGPDGRPVPTLVYLEECQHLLADPVFEARVKDWLETFRKKLTAVWMTTQSPESVLTSRIWPAVRDNVRTRILLPNPEARSATLRELYERHLSLNEVQIEALATGTGKGQFMVVQPGLSRMVNLHLDPDTLACLRSDKAAQGTFDRVYRAGDEGWQARYIHELMRGES